MEVDFRTGVEVGFRIVVEVGFRTGVGHHEGREGLEDALHGRRPVEGREGWSR